MQACNDNDEALQPHAGVHDDRHDPEQHRRIPEAAQPQQLRKRDVARNQKPIEITHGPEGAVLKRVQLKAISAVPSHEGFHKVAISDDQSGREHHLRHILKVAHGDEILHTVCRPNRDHQCKHHRESRVDRARDEVRREDRGVPARDDRNGEIPAHNRMHGKNQRRREARKQKIGSFIPRPMTRRPTPTHRQHTVDRFCNAVFGVIAESG